MLSVTGGEVIKIIAGDESVFADMPIAAYVIRLSLARSQAA